MLLFFQDTTLHLCPSPEKLKPFEIGNEKSPLLSVQELGDGNLVIPSSCSYSEKSHCKDVSECTRGYNRGREGGLDWGSSPDIYTLLCIKRAFQVTLAIKNSPANAGRCKRPGFHPWVGKIPWRRSRQPTPVFLPGEPRGQRRLEGYSPFMHV